MNIKLNCTQKNPPQAARSIPTLKFKANNILLSSRWKELQNIWRAQSVGFQFEGEGLPKAFIFKIEFVYVVKVACQRNKAVKSMFKLKALFK